MAARDLTVLWRQPGFRLLYATRLTSQFGDGVFQAALASFVLFAPQQETSARQVAVAFALLLLPYSVLGPFTGVFLDRWQRQRVLVWCNVVRPALLVAVAAQVLAGRTGAVFLATAIAALGVNRFYLAGLSSALPRVVEEGRLVVANALATTSGTIATAVGAGVGLGLRVGLGGRTGVDAGLVAVAAATYLIAAGVATRFGVDELGPTSEERAARATVAVVVAGLVAGLRHLAERPRAARALGAVGAYRFLFGVMVVAVVLLERNTFHSPHDSSGGLAGVAAAFTATALGVPLAALATPSVVARLGRGRDGKPATIAVALTAAGVALALLAVTLRAPVVLLAAFVVGFVGQMVKICVDTTVQEQLTDAYRGRVFAVYDALYNVAFVAAAAIAAVALPSSGRAPGALVALALGFVATAVAVLAGDRVGRTATT